MTSAFMDDERDRGGVNEPTDLSRAASVGDDDGYRGLTPRMAWRCASLMFLATAIGCLVQVGIDLDGEAIQSDFVVAVLATAGLSMAGAFWVLGAHGADPRWLHVAMLLSYALLAGALNQAPAVEGHIGIVYLEPLIFAALFLPSRALGFYIALSIGFIAWSTISRASEESGIVPGIMTSAALVSVASLTLYVRLQLDHIGRQAAFLSGRDALTGLANLRPLYEHIETMIAAAERHETGLTVLMLDLEGFKRVNDQHSHSVGDQTLRAVGDTLLASARREELVARRGGDEFAVVTGTTDPDEIEAMIERITSAIAETRFELLPTMPTGVTVGQATMREGDTVGQLLARADRSLHEAKAAARIERWTWGSSHEGTSGIDLEPGD
ncbi:MAG: GGDEF domain-containing protein [Solirubrobacterales bacterium]